MTAVICRACGIGFIPRRLQHGAKEQHSAKRAKGAANLNTTT
jgi:hypothetical protein